MTWRERVLHWLRVPNAPTAPAGDADVRVFRASPNFYRYQILKLVLLNVGALIGVLVALRFSSGFTRSVPDSLGPIARIVTSIVQVLEAGAIVGLIAQAIGSFLLARLDFEQRWYILTDRSIRTRDGLIRLHERTMTLANIQHVSIRQGPIQRLLGIADIEIRSAGGSAPKPGEDNRQDSHIAYFRGIDTAHEVRDLIRDRLRRYRDAGLGDPDDSSAAVTDERTTEPAMPVHQSPAGATPLVLAAREFAAEARRLRELTLSDRV